MHMAFTDYLRNMHTAYLRDKLIWNLYNIKKLDYTAKSVHNYTTKSQLNSYNITLDLTNENVAKCVNFFSSIIFTSYKISTGDKIWYWIITGWITLSAKTNIGIWRFAIIHFISRYTKPYTTALFTIYGTL